MIRWPWTRGAAPAAPAPQPRLTCLKCAADEFVILQIAGQICARGARPSASSAFAPTRSRLACAHCLTTYSVRLDRPEIRLESPGPSAGSLAVMTEIAPEAPAAAPPPAALDVPGSVEDLLALLDREPKRSLVE